MRCPTVLVHGGTPFNLEGEGDHIFGEGSHSLTALLTLPPPSFTPTFSITSNSQFGLLGSWKASVELNGQLQLMDCLFRLFMHKDRNLGLATKKEPIFDFVPNPELCGRRRMTALCAVVWPIKFDIRKRISKRKRC